MTRGPIVDFELLTKRVGGDMEFLIEIIDIFLGHCPGEMAKLQDAIRSHDAKAVEKSAHVMRGYFVSLHASPASEVALELELKGRSGNLDGSTEVFGRLSEEVQLVKSSLHQQMSTSR